MPIGDGLFESADGEALSHAAYHGTPYSSSEVAGQLPGCIGSLGLLLVVVGAVWLVANPGLFIAMVLVILAGSALIAWGVIWHRRYVASAEALLAQSRLRPPKRS